MTQVAISPEMAACINECNQCHLVCLNMATGHCLAEGGRHAAPEHLRTMLVCAEMCRTAAYVMITGSTLYHRVCGACAEICDACLTACLDLDDMEACVESCQRCKECCEVMASD